MQRGGKDDTVLLNINFKTIIVSFFREKMFLNELSEEDIEQLCLFCKRSPSFKSLASFCGLQGEQSSINR